MKYFANYKVNNGTHLVTPIEGSNKKTLLKDIIRLATAERYEGNEGSFSVWKLTANDEPVEVFVGHIDRTGSTSVFVNYTF